MIIPVSQTITQRLRVGNLLDITQPGNCKTHLCSEGLAPDLYSLLDIEVQSSVTTDHPHPFYKGGN